MFHNIYIIIHHHHYRHLFFISFTSFFRLYFACQIHLNDGCVSLWFFIVCVCSFIFVIRFVSTAIMLHQRGLNRRRCGRLFSGRLSMFLSFQSPDRCGLLDSEKGSVLCCYSWFRRHKWRTFMTINNSTYRNISAQLIKCISIESWHILRIRSM